MFAMKTEVSRATRTCQALRADDYLPDGVNTDVPSQSRPYYNSADKGHQQDNKKINRNNLMHQFVNRLPVGGPAVAREQQQQQKDGTRLLQGGNNYLYMPINTIPRYNIQ